MKYLTILFFLFISVPVQASTVTCSIISISNFEDIKSIDITAHSILEENKLPNDFPGIRVGYSYGFLTEYPQAEFNPFKLKYENDFIEEIETQNLNSYTQDIFPLALSSIIRGPCNNNIPLNVLQKICEKNPNNPVCKCIPEPSSIFLFGFGILFGMIFLRNKTNT